MSKHSWNPICTCCVCCLYYILIFNDVVPLFPTNMFFRRGWKREDGPLNCIKPIGYCRVVCADSRGRQVVSSHNVS